VRKRLGLVGSEFDMVPHSQGVQCGAGNPRHL
jgi:hypothetical protein